MSQIACGYDHSISLNTNGVVYSWGDGDGGLLGHGNLFSLFNPTPIVSLPKINAIRCGGLHTMVLDNDN